MRKLGVLILFVFILTCGRSNKENHETGKKDFLDISTLQKSSAMMSEEKFWVIVSDSLEKTSSKEEQEVFLVNTLLDLPLEEIIGFRLSTDKLLYDSYTAELWCAAYILNGGCSDDGFEYFRNWLISRGKHVFYKAKENPDYLINEVKDEKAVYEFESFWYVANKAFKRRTQKNLYDYLDYEKFLKSEGNYPQIKFTWQEDKPETMKSICPMLFKRLCK